MPRFTLALAFVSLLAAPAAAQTDWNQAQEVEVRLTSFAFTPREIRLPAGRPIRLRLVNAGRGGHDFTARDFFAGSRVQTADRARVVSGSVEVPPQATVEILLVPRAGRYRLKCGHSFHKQLGMRGEIVVE